MVAEINSGERAPLRGYSYSRTLNIITIQARDIVCESKGGGGGQTHLLNIDKILQIIKILIP